MGVEAVGKCGGVFDCLTCALDRGGLVESWWWGQTAGEEGDLLGRKMKSWSERLEGKGVSLSGLGFDTRGRGSLPSPRRATLPLCMLGKSFSSKTLLAITREVLFITGGGLVPICS